MRYKHSSTKSILEEIGEKRSVKLDKIDNIQNTKKECSINTLEEEIKKIKKIELEKKRLLEGGFYDELKSRFNSNYEKSPAKRNLNILNDVFKDLEILLQENKEKLNDMSNDYIEKMRLKYIKKEETEGYTEALEKLNKNIELTKKEKNDITDENLESNLARLEKEKEIMAIKEDIKDIKQAQISCANLALLYDQETKILEPKIAEYNNLINKLSCTYSEVQVLVESSKNNLACSLNKTELIRKGYEIQKTAIKFKNLLERVEEINMEESRRTRFSMGSINPLGYFKKRKKVENKTYGADIIEEVRSL